MTWLKLSDDFPDALARVGLSDAAFRTHVEALCWVMRRETGGRLSERDVRRACESTEVAHAVDELVDAGFWDRTPDGYVVAHHMEHQIEPEVLLHRRAQNAARQRRHRRKKAGLADLEGSPGSSPLGDRPSAPSRPVLTRVTRRVTP